jgi:hypothetical protein
MRPEKHPWRRYQGIAAGNLRISDPECVSQAPKIASLALSSLKTPMF